MKKLILVGCLALVAVIVTPVATASALEGQCKIFGKAKFTEGPLKVATLEKHGFAFEGSKFAASATEALEPEKTGCVDNGGVFHKVSLPTEVTGSGELSCAASKGGFVAGSVTGEGRITIDGTTREFGFKFEAAAGVVAVEVTPKGGSSINAKGAAEFLTPEPGKGKEIAEKCAKSEIESLNFEALLKGTF
jgi:hypothetical protein